MPRPPAWRRCSSPLRTPSPPAAPARARGRWTPPSRGGEKPSAIQAGREIRVLVKPQEIDDLTAAALARDLAKKIESDLEYPGQIKVTVLRETRAIEYAR